MTFNELIGSTIAEGFNVEIPTVKVLVSLLFAVLLGLYIFYIYKFKSKSHFYSKEFNIVLAILPIITSGIVLAMQSSLVISLGMVGALSIVRFRNAVKTQLDLLFLFWAISVGIICGSGIYEIAIIISALVTIVMFSLDLTREKNKSILLIINGSKLTMEEAVEKVLKEDTKNYKVKSRSVTKDCVDIIYEIRCNNEQQLVKDCSKIKSVECFNLITHDGETRY